MSGLEERPWTLERDRPVSNLNPAYHTKKNLGWLLPYLQTRPFRYDLNQIPYDYTMEVTNRFKGLDPIARVSEEQWTEVPDIVQEAVIKTNSKKKKCKKVAWGGLTNSCEKKRSKRQRRKGNIYPFECRVLKDSKER